MKQSLARRRAFGIAAALVAVSSVFPAALHAQATRPGSEIRAAQAPLPAGVKLTTWAEGLEHPWGLALLPTGSALVTERPGRLRVVAPDGSLSPAVVGVPKVDARGQGGLLDVAVHPDFPRNMYIYLSYSEPGEASGTNSTAVARARLRSAAGVWRLDDVEVIFRQSPKYAGSLHFGSRLVFDKDGHLFVTLGERSSRSTDAQGLSTHHGKVIRITEDGKVPEGNPYAGRSGALPEIWSLGHRNPQGAGFNPRTGDLWVAEHGPQGGDEVNVVRRGANYGWPLFTYGERYGGGKIGEEASKPGYQPPLYSWVPSVSPSGMAFYDSDRIASWKGSVLIGALSGQALIRLQLDGDKVVKEERLLADMGARVRNVTVGPQGQVYLLTDASRGKILLLSPAP